MKKSLIKKSAILLAIIMALTLSFAACGSDTDDDANSDPGTSGDNNDAATDEVYTIGFNIFGAGTPTFDVMTSEIEYSLGVFGMKGSMVSDEFTADKELQNVQNFASSGVQGVLIQTSAPPVLPQASEICLSAKLPFALGIFVGEDADRAKIAEDNEYYAGAVHTNLYEDGYLIGQTAAADGHTKAVLLGGNVGDIHFEQRIAGFTKSFVEEGGGEILETARCSSPAEGQEKANAMLSANRDADCLYAMVGDYVPGALNAEDSLGLEAIPVYASNAGVDTPDFIRAGRVAAAGAGNDLGAGISLALLINFLDGHKIVDADGVAPELINKTFLVTKDNVDDFENMFFTEGNHPLTPEVLKTLVWRTNPDVSYDTFADLVNNGLSFEALMEDHK